MTTNDLAVFFLTLHRLRRQPAARSGPMRRRSDRPFPMRGPARRRPVRP